MLLSIGECGGGFWLCLVFLSSENQALFLVMRLGYNAHLVSSGFRSWR